MKLEDQSVHTAQICDDPVWKRKNEIVLADDGKERMVMKHNYIELKHRRGTIITIITKVKERLILDQRNLITKDVIENVQEWSWSLRLTY